MSRSVDLGNNKNCMIKKAKSLIKVKHSKTSFEKNCFSAWASTLNMGLINKVDMVCLSPVGYGVQLTFRALALRRSSLLRRRANARNVN